ncbi:MAG: class II aldolase/adducin family protein [Oscillospiraceae bacterium]
MEQSLHAVREELCKVGLTLYQRGYVVSNDGNISVRTGENELWITPSGVSKGRMTPDMMVCIDLDGTLLAGDRHPSSEYKMHLEVYRARPDVGAVVHAHPPCATAFAVCQKPLDTPYLPELILSVGEVPLAPFAMPSTDQVPRSIAPFLRDHQAVLLANHGALTWGDDLWSAFDRMEIVEHAARITRYVGQLGGGITLTAEQVAQLRGMGGFYKNLAAPRSQSAPAEEGGQTR